MSSSKITSVHALIIRKDNKILLTKRGDVPIWVIPGGHVEPGEKPEDAVKREIKEELGIKVKNIKPIVEYSYPNTKKMLFRTLVVKVNVIPCSDEVKDYGWFDATGLPKPMSLHDMSKVNDYNMYKGELLKKKIFINKKAELINLAKNLIHLLVVLIYLIKNKITGGSFKF